LIGDLNIFYTKIHSEIISLKDIINTSDVEFKGDIIMNTNKTNVYKIPSFTDTFKSTNTNLQPVVSDSPNLLSTNSNLTKSFDSSNDK